MDKGNEFGALLTDLSNALDCTDHKLLIEKLFWYGVSPSSINLIFSYLSTQTQRVKIEEVTVIKVISNMEFHNAQFLVHCYLKLIYVMIVKLQVMPTIRLYILV